MWLCWASGARRGEARHTVVVWARLTLFLRLLLMHLFWTALRPSMSDGCREYYGAKAKGRVLIEIKVCLHKIKVSYSTWYASGIIKCSWLNVAPCQCPDAKQRGLLHSIVLCFFFFWLQSNADNEQRPACQYFSTRTILLISSWGRGRVWIKLWLGKEHAHSQCACVWCVLIYTLIPFTA